jgi:hypothetical protein
MPPPPGEPCLSGVSILNSRQSLEEVAGKEAVERAIAELSAADRAAYLAVTAGSWLPVRIADELQRAVAREAQVPFDGFPQFVREFSHRSVARMVGTVWRFFLQLTSDEALIERTPDMHRKAYNVGHLTAEVESPGRALVKLTEWPNISDEQLIGIAAGIEAVLQAAGRKSVVLKWKRNADGAEYTASWEP